MFRINGGVCHRIGSLLPATGKVLCFAQLYVHDTVHVLDHRLKILNPEGERTAGPEPVIVATELIPVLSKHIKLAREFKVAAVTLLPGFGYSYCLV